MMGREKPRILCVSRSVSQLAAIRSALPSRDFEVVDASTPEQAVAMAMATAAASATTTAHAREKHPEKYAAQWSRKNDQHDNNQQNNSAG